MRGGSLNALWSEAFFDELARAGVRVICIAPGSRSTPLVLAAAQDRRFRLISVIDERSAGFVALGVGKGSGRPAAVITTSGTAGANLYPAVIEAAQAEVPLIVLTADRPHRLRDTDGNQAMDQLRLFGSFPRGFFEVPPPKAGAPDLRHLRGLAARAVSLSSGPPAGPVHLNFPFEKPLEPDLTGAGHEAPLGSGRSPEAEPEVWRGRPDGEPFVAVPPPTLVLSEADTERVRALIREAERGVIVAGPVPNPGAVGPAVAALASATGFPVLADPLSGARFLESPGAHRVAMYDLFLRAESARSTLTPDLILRIGGSPTSAAALDYLDEHRAVRQMVIDDGARWRDHLAAATDYLCASPAEILQDLASGQRREPKTAWRDMWLAAERATRAVVENPPGEGLLEGQVMAAVVERLSPGANLFVASSMPIRDLDAFVPSGPNGIRVFGNRGVSGIDGLVSTTVGLAVAATDQPTDSDVSEGSEAPQTPERARPPAAPTVGVLGDLALFHDLNGLQAVRTAGVPVVFVVVNNDGGGIFQTLPVRDHEPTFTTFFSTPHGMDFKGAALLHGLAYASGDDLETLGQQLTTAMASGEPTLLEIKTSKEVTHERRRAVVEAVVTSVNELWPGTGP